MGSSASCVAAEIGSSRQLAGSGRALKTFRQVWPEVTWGARGVFPGDTLAKSIPVYEAGVILAEYLKRAWYAVRY